MSSPPEFRCLAVSPAGTPDPALAIAGSRAGALGVLNLEFASNQAAALDALRRLAAHVSKPFGVLIDCEDEGLLQAVLSEAPAGLETVILANSDGRALAPSVEAVRRTGKQVYLVVTSLDAALEGESLGVDALIAKGHESGGWVGEETAFVLLQRLLPRVQVPVLVQGGIGLRTAAACYAAGAAGVVLDSQLLLAKESPLLDRAPARIEMMDGSETQAVGGSFGAAFRAYSRADAPIVETLRQLEFSDGLTSNPLDAARKSWREAIRSRVDWREEGALWPVGQDGAFAAGLARRFLTVGGIVAAIETSVRDLCRLASEITPLAAGAPLAESHQTRYPIVQGPMTRVSDRSAFAEAVAEAGALPFLALALMRGDESRKLLEETKALLGDRSWGVGVLGFVPPALRAEQLEAIRANRPPFALIAGGRPDQARILESEGIPTYLHVPSPGLLRMFLQDGARRFVFEGRECGGHVGPRSSFVLWETMIEVLLDHLDAKGPKGEYHVLFAGGISDGLSAAMVSALAAPLADRGIRIGVLIGTAYLFTAEAVSAGAIQPAFQQAAIESSKTVTLEATPGYATRCLPSPFAGTFAEEKRRLISDGVATEDLKEQLEELNIGRLRIAAKGVDRNPRFGKDADAPRLLPVAPADQWRQGMFMIGQVAALRDRVCTLAELHADVSDGSVARLSELVLPDEEPESAPPPAAIAIVGMASILPGAPDLKTYWSNILNKVDSVTEVPRERWDWQQYFDADRNAHDKVYSRWGGFIDPVPFDPLVFGMPPSSLASIEPYQLIALSLVRAALDDAGYLDRPFPRERTSVMLGASGGGADLLNGYMVRSSLPGLFGDAAPAITEQLGSALPEWTEDSFAGLLMNVAAGRVANRFNFGGLNYTMDAACASSLAAVYSAVRDLEAGTSDVVIVGGVDGIQTPFGFYCFSKTQALSPTGRSRPFDEDADGIAISEGYAALVLKRLDDAERDGDRIYAVIRGVGGSSDGRDRGLTAPRPEGQIRALGRAYAQAGYSPASVGLIEAHGTGTVVGDQTEVQSLTRFFSQAGAGRQSTALGSVKSMIGHTKSTAGAAGLVKVALALHHKVLPPTLGVTKPNAKANFAESPLYVNSEARPWVRVDPDEPRRAGVSAFGFGGTNFHIAVEEYEGGFLAETDSSLSVWPAELFVWRGASRSEIAHAVTDLRAKLEQGARPRLVDLARTLALRSEASPGPATLAIASENLEQLMEQLAQATALLEADAPRAHTPQGIHFSDQPLAAEGKVAYLFPGQGSQYVNMHRDLALLFPEVREVFERADQIVGDRLGKPLSRFIYPPPAFTPEEEKAQQAELTATNVAQPALGAAGLAVSRLLNALGVRPGAAAGHSYGEFVALNAAGSLTDEDLLRLSEARGRFMQEGITEESGTMAAIIAGAEALAPLVADSELVLANLNAPTQTVVSGTRAEVDHAVAWCEEHGLTVRRLEVACAFHSRLVAPAQKRLAALLAETHFDSPSVPVFSNTTAAAYPSDPAAIATQLAEHLARPVDFVHEVEAMYDAGARLFVEVGPRQVLSGLVDQILGDKPHVCAPIDSPRRDGLVQLLHALATLVSEGVPVNLDRLFSGRGGRRLDLSKLETETGVPVYSPTTWLVDGGGVRPIRDKDAVREPLRPIQVQLMDAGMSPIPQSNGVPKPAADVSTASRNGTQNGPYKAAPAAPAPVAASTTPLEQTNGAFAPVPITHADAAATAPAPIPTTSSPMSSGPPPAAASPAASPVVEHFQQVMQRFLDVQESVMLRLLGAAAARPVASSAPHGTLLAIPTPEVPPTVMSVAGVASEPVAPVATAPAEPVAAVTPPVVEPEAAAAVVLDRDEITAELLSIVSTRTGYPTESLSLDADLEADLGIDSIKRVEILGAILRSSKMQSASPPDMESLTDTHTLTDIVDRLEAAAS